MNPKLKIIEEQLTLGNVNGAIKQARNIIEKYNKGHFTTSIDEIELTYTQMIRYFIAGTVDERRSEVIGFIKYKIYEICRDILLEEDLKTATSKFYDIKRSLSLSKYSVKTIFNESLIDLSSPKEYYQSLNLLFHYVMACDNLSEEDIQTLLSLSNHDIIYMTISAAMIGVCEVWSFSKVEYIFKALVLFSDKSYIQINALFAIVLISWHQQLMIKLSYPKIESLWSLAKDDCPDYVQIIREIILKIYQNRENEHAYNLITSSIKKNIGSMDISNIKNLNNLSVFPSHDIVNNSSLEYVEKVNSQIDQLRDRGIDLTYVSFRSVYIHPFFNDIYKFFIPFNINHPDYSSYIDDPVIQNKLTEELSSFSDVDAYALRITIDMLGSMLKDAPLSQMIEGIKNMQGVDNISDKSKLIKWIVGDFYRFITLSRDAKHLFNPFLDVFVQDVESPIFSSEIINDKLLADICYSLSYNNLSKLNTQEIDTLLLFSPNNEHLLTLKSEIYEHKGDYIEALHILKDLFRITNKEEILPKIANCMYNLNLYDEALNVYIAIEKDKVNLEKIIMCYIYTKRYTKALDKLEEVVSLYGEDRQTKSMRAMCLIYTNNIEESFKIYSEIIATGTLRDIDNLYVGHCHLCRGEYDLAIEYYKKYNSFTGQNIFTYVNKKDYLLSSILKVDEDTISLVVDSLHINS